MVFVAVVLSLAAGFAGGWYVTKKGYTAKLNSIAAEVRDYERSTIGEVRTLAARVKAFL